MIFHDHLISDAVLVGIIALVSGVIASICGVLSSYLSAKRMSTSQMQQAVLTHYLDARLDAFSHLNETFSAWCLLQTTEAKSEFYTACNTAMLVASPETNKVINDLQDWMEKLLATKQYKESEFWMVKHQLILALHQDMNSFSLPRISRKSQIHGHLKDPKRKKK